MVAIMQSERERERERERGNVVAEKVSVCTKFIQHSLWCISMKSNFLIFDFPKKKQLVIFANEILIHLKIAFVFSWGEKREVA